MRDALLSVRCSLIAILLAVIGAVCCVIATVKGYHPQGIFFGIGKGSDEFAYTLRVTGGILGGVGILAYLWGFLRKEPLRFLLVGLILALLVAAWEFLLVSVGVVIIIMIFAALGGAIG